MKNILYKILNINKTASKEEIKKAYRNKSKKLHPDVGGNVEEFKELSRAYNILSDDIKREKYDDTDDDNYADESDDLRSEAIKRISSMFISFLDDLSKNNDYFFNMNIIEIMNERTNKVIIDTKKDINKIKKLIKRINKYKEKIKYNGNKINILIKLCENKIILLNKQLGNMNKEIEIAEEIDNLLQNYEIDIEEINDIKENSVFNDYFTRRINSNFKESQV